MKKMILVLIFHYLCFSCFIDRGKRVGCSGVFGKAEEVKSVSVMEGDSVTLHTDLTDIQGDDMIEWTFGPQESHMVTIKRYTDLDRDSDIPLTYDYDERFRGRLRVDYITGSLNITHITTQHSGLYKFTIGCSGDRLSQFDNFYKFYKVTVKPSPNNLDFTVVICCVAVGSVMIVTALLICIGRKHTNTQQGWSVEDEFTTVIYEVQTDESGSGMM